MFQLNKRLSVLSLLLCSILISLAFGPTEKEENNTTNSFRNSLTLQGQVLQQIAEQQLLEAESSSQTVTERQNLLALRAMQAINEEPLYLLDRLFRKEKEKIVYAGHTLSALKKYIQELDQNYLHWALEQTQSKADPRWIALEKKLSFLASLEDLETGELGMLQARVLYSQLQLAEQAALDIFLQEQKAAYWPFETIQLDWEQAPSFVGVPAQGRIVIGAFVKDFPATVAQQQLPVLGKGYYYETLPNTIGKQEYKVSFEQENPLTKERRVLSKTIPYQVVIK